MTCQWSSIRRASRPTSSSLSWSTAVRTVSDRPSQVASPQPTIPDPVSTRTNSHRGGTRNVSTRPIFVMVTSALGGAGGEAGDDVLLHEQGDHHDREGDDGRRGHQAAPVDARVADEVEDRDR